MRSQFTATPDNAMSSAEIATFLNEKREARLGTVDEAGAIHLTPIWYWYDDGVVYFLLGESRRHLKNLRIRTQATILVDEDRRYLDGWSAGAKAVMFSGQVQLSSDESAVAEGLQKLRLRYLGPDRVEEPNYRQASGRESRVLCALDPDRVVSWDFAKAADNAGAK
jgi:PPOX class probable F420-dependent enzyme